MQKRKNPKDINSPLSSRDDGAESAPVPPGAAKSPKPSANGTAKPVKPLGASVPAGTAGVKTNGAVPAEVMANGVAPPGVPRARTEEPPAWSEAQEMSLVKALKAFPKETDNR